MAHLHRGLFAGALVGAIAAAPLCAFFYVGERAIGIPFVPFSIFEWIAGVLPGALLTRSIDAMVAVIRRLGLEDTSEAAKVMEAWTGIAVYVLLCAVAGAIVFAGRGRALVAAAVGLLLLAVSLAAAGSTTGASLPWIAAGIAGWAFVTAYARRRTGRVAASRPEASTSRRRVLVRLAGASAVLTFVGVSIGRRTGRPGVGGAGEGGEPWSKTHALPNADAEVPPVPGTRPELTAVGDHYRIDINIRPPVIREQDWRLTVDGLVRERQTFTLAQLKALPSMDQFITLSCISNPVGGDLIGTQRWTGVSFARFLEALLLMPEATHLRLYAADGFDEVVALEQIRSDPRVMLTWAWDGLPLTAEHGFPLRVYIPDRFGMKQPKWIERIEAISGWAPGYWVRRGWDAEAMVRATSVIDVIGPDAVVGEDGQRLLPIGGIAYAGARGVSRVEVQVDGGPWNAATLREPISEKTWVLWRYEWPFREGAHTFAVRCVDGSGTPQRVEPARPHPSGATGIHQRRITT